MSRKLNQIETEAVAWLTRRDRNLSSLEQAEFDRWCAADPAHARAVAEISAVWSVFDQPRHSPRAGLLQAELKTLRRRTVRRWTYGGAAAVTLTAACLMVVFQMGSPVAAPEGAPNTATARVEEPGRQTLPDGSVVEFKPGATISVAFEPGIRRVILNRSEAHFSVVKDPSRPFIVDAGGVQVRAVGTAFCVQRGLAEVEVVVTEGQVAVERSPTGVPTSAAVAATANSVPPFRPVLLAAGHRVVVAFSATTPAPVESLSPPDLNERLAWRLPKLDLSETSIVEAIALFNRHSGPHSPRLVLGDETVAARRLTGFFRSDNVEGFVRALESSFGVRAERRPGEIILRSK
jgi:transmembrane sensor